MSFFQSKSDYNLFIHHTSFVITMVLIYVDDLVIYSNNQDYVNKLKIMLAHVFHMKNLGSLSYNLGLEVDRSAVGIFLSK